MADNTTIAKAIRSLYEITNDLESRYPGRSFTPDGHLIGSIGEIYAAEHYGLKLFKASEKAHDGIAPDGRLVQVKDTQRKRIGISERPDYLIVLHIDERGDFEEIYNGSGKPIWNLLAKRKLPKNGQYQISISRLKSMNDMVDSNDRIPAMG